MYLSRTIHRRRFLARGLGLAITAPFLASRAAETAINPDQGVTAPEDLMKEHGVLDRCLLIYEEGLRRVRRQEDIAPEVFNHTAQLVRRFVEDYHEHNEEKYIFPQFERTRKLVELVETLKTQHEAGRKVTARIMRLSQPEAFRSAANRNHLSRACRSFIRMYRPHEAREDTVLFPALRTILSPSQVLELGERMEEEETRILGDEGFEKNVDDVAQLEKQLGIWDLSQFTPKV